MKQPCTLLDASEKLRKGYFSVCASTSDETLSDQIVDMYDSEVFSVVEYNQPV
jgi:hypothetical protein